MNPFRLNELIMDVLSETLSSVDVANRGNEDYTAENEAILYGLTTDGIPTL